MYHNPPFAKLIQQLSNNPSSPDSSVKQSSDSVKSTASLAELSTLKPKILIDANALLIRLPRSIWHAYFTYWLQLYEPNRFLPVLPTDGKLRDAFVINAWNEVIPRLVRNQLLPPFSATQNNNNNNVQNESDAQRSTTTGPDFYNLSAWFLDACREDGNYLNERENNPELTTTKVLPEGLLEATQYAWLTQSFRAAWFSYLMDFAVRDQAEIWTRYMFEMGRGEKYVYDDEGLKWFKKELIMTVDPWARIVEQQDWRM
ncbi:hypothetical protein HDV05_008617 [Chytridiales sp. JEL 0842]|nr:hypothetical protein HDV05_008617 [Chytridiales sp. JEL 0842]